MHEPWHASLVSVDKNHVTTLHSRNVRYNRSSQQVRSAGSLACGENFLYQSEVASSPVYFCLLSCAPGQLYVCLCDRGHYLQGSIK